MTERSPLSEASRKFTPAREIVERDIARIQKYRESLRGYQVRPDILEHLSSAVDLRALAGRSEIRLADFGSGPGISGLHIRDHLRSSTKARVRSIFLDVSEPMLTQVPEEEDIERVRGDVTALPLRDNNLDIIVMKQVLDYLEEAAQRKALVEVYRTLRENGQFILSALISPDSQVDEVTNELYTRRETIIGRVPIKKLIPNEELLKTWLQETGFRGIESVYRYDIPLSVEDFRTSFGLDAERTRALSELYGDILARDKQHVFRGGDFQGSPQLIEQGLIVRSAK